jgi:hypothetical protein
MWLQDGLTLTRTNTSYVTEVKHDHLLQTPNTVVGDADCVIGLLNSKRKK